MNEIGLVVAGYVFVQTLGLILRPPQYFTSSRARWFVVGTGVGVLLVTAIVGVGLLLSTLSAWVNFPGSSYFQK